MKNLILLLTGVMLLTGCQKYVWDSKAERCRDSNTGQFVNSELCKQ